MRTKITRLFLSAVLMMCCMSVWADLGTPPNNEIWYTTDNKSKLTSGKYDVGEKLCGSTISEHGESNGHYYIKFNADIDYINEKDFNDEDNITEVSLPNSVEKLGYRAFSHCNRLKNIDLGSGLKYIGAYDDDYGVFEECDELENIALPPSVTFVGRNAFYDCDALKSFSCENVEFICPQAFYNCDNLKSVNLGTKLEEIRWTNQGYAFGVFEECDELEVIGIPASVTTLGRRAFYNCDKLKFVAIGSGVTRINEQAFKNCYELKSVVIDGNGVSIGEDAFNDCEKLESVSFLGSTPPSSFGDDCFSGCKNLKYHVLEENYDSYNGNSLLSGKVVAGPPYNEIWYSTNNGGTAGHSLSSTDYPKLNAYMGSHGVQFFDGNPPEFNSNDNCFKNCWNLVSVVLPSSITYIGNLAFYSCPNLVSVSIPGTVTGIGENAFCACHNLQNIKLPAGLNSIGRTAFESTGLQSITIPSGVNTIGGGAFMECGHLRSVTILGTIQNIHGQAFYSCSNLSEIYYLGEGTPDCDNSSVENSFKNCPATIYVKDVAGHGNWVDRPVLSWRSGNGDGSSSSPLEIESYPQLYGFSLEVEYMNGANLCAKLTKDITGSTNVLNEDGTPKGSFKPWLPIGSRDNNYNSSYKGEFDGNGHTISGLYFNDETRSPVGLFGMANGANIHDVGVKDSYFRGMSHVGGICGDLAKGRIENCWNGATVQSAKGTAGGIAGSCWHSAYMSGCYNIGKVSEGAFCGGVCGSVAKNTAGVTYSLSNCFSLEGKCNVAYNLYGDGAGINNVSIKNASAFASGEVCYILNAYQTSFSNKWRQQLGVDGYPILSGDYFVYYNATSQSYYNHDEDISGSGTVTDPYRIGSKFELLKFANIVNTQNTEVCGILTADITMNTGVLDSNGNLNGDGSSFSVWTPIGTSEKSYAGTFDGNGHTISGLYINDATRDCAALFGKTGNTAYIHNLGVKDSYFRGNIWVAGICADFASGKIENCWNGATVVGCHVSTCAGGIAGSCWKNASVSGCYNIGKISVESGCSDSQCGGICGIVARNTSVTNSVSNCVSLTGKCEKAYNVYTENSDYTGIPNESYLSIGNASVDNVLTKDASAFTSGEVCWILNGNKYGRYWRQQLGTDAYPTLSGTYSVNYTDERQYYNNELTREIWYTSTDGKIVTPYPSYSFGANITNNTYGGGWGVITFDKAVTSIGANAFLECSSLKSIEIPDNVTSIGGFAFQDCSSLKSIEIPDNVTSIGKMAFYKCGSLQSINIPSGVKSIGEYAFLGCSSLKSIEIPDNVTSIGDYTFQDCSSLNSIEIPDNVTSIGDYAFQYCSSLNSIEIPDNVTSIGDYAFQDCSSLKSIEIPDNVTSIGKLAFYECGSLQSINIPSGVTSIRESAFAKCNSLTTITFNSLPVLGTYAFYPCGKLDNKILDLTDSDKPFIGTSLDNYPAGGFTEAHYHRSLEKGKWGTIVLPFAPTDGSDGLEFYELKEMTLDGDGSLTFTKVDAPFAGVPYLIRNISDSKTDFTLTASDNPTVTVNATNQTADGFALKGSFKQVSLNTPEKKNENLYYLKDNEFYHANGQINIAPFRAYIEGSGTSNVKSFMLVVSDNGDDVTAIPGILDENGSIDETEAIYDLNGRRLAAPVKGQVNVIRTKSGKTIKRLF